MSDKSSLNEKLSDLVGSTSRFNKILKLIMILLRSNYNDFNYNDWTNFNIGSINLDINFLKEQSCWNQSTLKLN